MRTTRAITRLISSGILATALFLFSTASAFAHCDTASGPVIPEAKTALEKGDVTPILKWVKPEYEAEIKAAFTKTLTVRTQGPEAKALADQFFLETLVRIHRAGEGAPYNGIKDEPVEPIVAMADKALAQGAADEMIKEIGNHMTAAIKQKFNKALAAKKDKDKSIAAGREFVEAYVTYMHYVEGIHGAITSLAGHQHAGPSEKAAPASEHKKHKE